VEAALLLAVEMRESPDRGTVRAIAGKEGAG
jgi:hypothetical protein